jgi:hypothetical protein
MQKNIYVLKLEQNRYFIHFSEVKSNFKILRECEIYYDYLKKYKPLNIIETFPFENFLDVDKVVKQYMYIYGYAYVRGGSYTEEELPPYLEKTLNHEFNNEEKDELYYQSFFNEILQKYEYNQQTLDEIQSQINNIQSEFKKFNYEKNKLEKTKNFFVDGEKYNMKNFFIEDIDWLYEICILNTDIDVEINARNIESVIQSNYVKKYKKMLYYLKQIYYLFTEYDLFSKYPNIENNIYLKHPEFLFDSFIYEDHSKNTELLFEICKTFLFMGNVIHNIFMEQEFDVNSYGFAYEWEIPKILYILETKREKLIHSAIDNHLFIPNVD